MSAPEQDGVPPGALNDVDAPADLTAPQHDVDAPADSPAPQQEQAGPAPLTSLTSLLGGSLEGGSACAADGTCD